MINGLNWKAGNKVIENAEVPEFILNMQYDDLKERQYPFYFLKWVFTCDGYVNSYSKAVGISFNRDITNLSNNSIKKHENAPKLLLNTRQCLINYCIKVSNPHFMNLRYRTDGISLKWRIEFQSKGALNMFYNDVGVELNNKTIKPEKIIKRG
ncbi:hypothetical protein JXA56_03370 [Candidatus Micrarchaeota archaeon]|nr:hypothetical protein [Candidatus Micrarchaeota archaeon]